MSEQETDGISQSEREKLQTALHDVHVAKEEISNYHASLKLAAAQNKIDDVLSDDSND